MPVVNNLKVMKFKLGQKIVQAGDFLMNFYIIGQGRCKVSISRRLIAYLYQGNPGNS